MGGILWGILVIFGNHKLINIVFVIPDIMRVRIRANILITTL